MANSMDYEYMDEQKIYDQLKCPVCGKPFCEPVTLSNAICVCRACVRSPESWTLVTEPIVLGMLNSILVQCKRCGRSNISRGAFSDHMLHHCPKATVLCTAADIKCPWFGSRDELAEHEKICKYEPLRPVLGFLFQEQTELGQRIASLESRISSSRP